MQKLRFGTFERFMNGTFTSEPLGIDSIPSELRATCDWQLHFGTSRDRFHPFGTSRFITGRTVDFGTSRNLTFHERTELRNISIQYFAADRCTDSWMEPSLRNLSKPKISWLEPQLRNLSEPDLWCMEPSLRNLSEPDISWMQFTLPSEPLRTGSIPSEPLGTCRDLGPKVRCPESLRNMLGRTRSLSGCGGPKETLTRPGSDANDASEAEEEWLGFFALGILLLCLFGDRATATLWLHPTGLRS